MTNAKTVRLLLVSRRRSRRQSVRAAIEFYGGNKFDVFETGRVERVADLVGTRKVQAIVLVRPEIHEWMAFSLYAQQSTAQQETVPVVVIGATNTKLSSHDLETAGIQGYLSVDNLSDLPTLLSELTGRNAPARPSEISSGDRRAMQTHLMDSRAVRESQKLISIGRLAAEIAHEINNPLESVGNLVYLAQCEPQLPERAGEYLRSAERELARVVQISKQTLSFHRESNEPTKLRVSDLMDEVVSLYSRRIQEKKLNVSREYSVEHTITALPGEIRQVLSNLVTNAIEASSSGGTLRLRMRESRRSGSSEMDGLRITVADGGLGISEESRRRIGELFFTTKGQSGTGLGLWVTKSIVARYGGTLRLKSSTGEKHGTVFSLFLPFKIRSTRAEARPKKQAPLRNNARKSRTAMTNVTEISRHPSHHDNQTHTANSVHQAAVNQPVFSKKRNG